MAQKKRAKKITMMEFRAWLQGVEEMQPAGWCPDETQWKVIREKINTIKDDTSAGLNKPAVPVPAGPIPRRPGHNPPPVHQPIPAPRGSSLEPETLVTNAQPAGVTMSPAARELLTGKKTPDSESGGGSAFE